MTTFKYDLPIESTGWRFDGKTELGFTWTYATDADDLLRLYDLGKTRQWDAATRIDWSRELDHDNPMGMPDEAIAIFGSDLWKKMSDQERTWLRRNLQAHSLSQFLHGEQAALIAASKIVASAPDLPAKFYAATQVMDEARHVEAFRRLLGGHLGTAYPISPPLKTLLEQILTDPRWDMTYLGMQVLIEGLALASFQRIRDQAKDPLVASLVAYVMQDEARHVAFGRISLRALYAGLSDKERDEREEFVVDACRFMVDHFSQGDVWARSPLPLDELIAFASTSDAVRQFKARLFSRIVPSVRAVGLWGKRVQSAFETLGALGYADVDMEAIAKEDQRIAESFEARTGVKATTGR